MYLAISGGGNVMYVCLYQKSVCNDEPKACTVGIYSTSQH